MTRKETNKEKAQRYLAEFLSTLNLTYFSLLTPLLNAAAFNIEDLGITQAELQLKLKSAYAMSVLSLLKTAEERRELFLFVLAEETIKEQNLSLDELGTTQEKLDLLKRACRIQTVKQLLVWSDAGSKPRWFKIAEKRLREFGLIPEDVGVTQAEFDAVRAHCSAT